MFGSIRDPGRRWPGLARRARRSLPGSVLISILVAFLTFAAAAVGLGTFGKFGKVKTIATGGVVYGLAIGDMNGDGKADILASNDDSTCPTASGHISLLLGKGNGSFKPAITLPDSNGPEGIAIGNFNGDKYKDFAVANYNCGVSSSVWIFLGKKGGGFKLKQKITVGPGAWLVRAVDLTGDGKTDLVVGNYNSSGPHAVAVLLGNGNGTFSAPKYYSSSGGVDGLAVGRMTSSKRPDVVTRDGSDNVCVLLTRANGSLKAPKCKSTSGGGGAYNSVALGDFNHDGKLDVAVADYIGERVLTFLGNGNGTLRNPIATPAGTLGPNGIVAGAFNRNGKLDVAIASYNSPYGTGVFLGKGNGKFKAPASYAGSNHGEDIAAGNLNADKAPDLVVGTDSGVDIFLNRP